MEQLVHGLRGNCLFLWPAAKGEKVNGKRYESVCPLRWWIRCKLEEEAFQSPVLWLFPILTALNCFLSFSPQPIPASLIFFLIFLSFFLFFHFYIFSTSAPLPSTLCCAAVGFWGCGGWQVELWEVERARAAFADCGTESWDSTAFSGNAVCSRNREAVRSPRELWPWAVSREKKSTQIHGVWTWTRRPRCPAYVCTHWHMVFCSKWIRQNPSWIIMKAQDTAAHRWEINKLVLLLCLPLIDIHECSISYATKGLVQC